MKDEFKSVTPSSARGLRLSSNARCVLERPAIPWVRSYYVVALPTAVSSHRDIHELHHLAHRVGRLLGRQRFGDPECYTLMYSAARTRRRPWPHVHVIVASSVQDKRRHVLLLQLKHVLRWRQWPMTQWLANSLKSLTSLMSLRRATFPRQNGRRGHSPNHA